MPGGGQGPVQGALARKIIESLNARGVSPQQPGPSGTNPDATGDSLSKSMSELRGADPGMLARTFGEMKKQIVQALPQVAFVVPAATKHLGKMLEGCNGFLKEIEQAANTEATVSKGGNLGHTAAMGQEAEPGGQGGAMPAMGGMGGGM
jgi:hypothetical protein